MAPDARFQWSPAAALGVLLSPIFLLAARRRVAKVGALSEPMLGSPLTSRTFRLPGSPDYVRLVDGVARRLPWRFSCLERSLAALWLSRLGGEQPEMIVGVARSGDRIRAHAWLAGDARGQQDYTAIWQSRAGSSPPQIP